MAITYLTTGGQKVFKSGGYVQKFLNAIKVSNNTISSLAKSLPVLASLTKSSVLFVVFISISHLLDIIHSGLMS